MRPADEFGGEGTSKEELVFYLGVLAVLKVAPAGIVERRVGVAPRVHVHGADGGGQHDAPHAGVGGGLDDVPRPGNDRLDDLLLRQTEASFV